MVASASFEVILFIAYSNLTMTFHELIAPTSLIHYIKTSPSYYDIPVAMNVHPS